MKKRLLSVLLTIAMVLSIAPTSFATETTDTTINSEENLIAEENNNNTGESEEPETIEESQQLENTTEEEIDSNEVSLISEIDEPENLGNSSAL